MGIYVYAADADDFSTMGLCGRLTPTRCEHDEVAGGMSELLLEHPLDDVEYLPGKRGRFLALEPGCVIKAPVPVRTTPEIQNGHIVTSVEQWTVKSTATKAERTMYSKATKGKKKKAVPGGTKVTVVARGDERYKCKTSKYGSGWMAIAALENQVNETIPNDPAGIETKEPAWSVQPQLFRIYEVERTDKGVTAHARHISYDLLGNLTTYVADNPTLGDALDGIMDNCAEAHEFEAKTNIADQRVDINFVDANPIKALLDPEEGMLKRWCAELVRDDFELIFLDRAGLNRGVTIEYGKNLLGVSCTTDFSNIATMILPYGENKDGERIYLSSDPDKPSTKITEASYIKSPLIGNYAFPRIYPLDVADAKVDSKKGGKDVTPALACQRLREAALDQFESGADLPTINLKVEFLKLGDAAEYAQYKGLDDVFLYDTVRVRHNVIGIALNLDVVRVKFDCLKEKCIEIELGTLRDMLTSIATFQLPSGINGGKIAQNTIGAGHLVAESVTADKIYANSIMAKHIQAEVISAEHINASLLVSEKIIVGICDIIQANILKADIGEAHIDWAGITDLYAIYAEIASAEIGKADIGFAQIKDLVAGTAIIREGVGGQLFIDRLAVNEANMVSLTTGEMIIKGDDGHFYSLSVDEDGNVKSTLKQVTGGDVANHTLNAGEKIIEGSITAALLNVKQIFASEALIGAITAANIDVGTLVAALIQSNLGATLDLSSNKAIQAIVNNDVVRQMIADSTRELRVTYDGAGTHMREDDDTTTMTAHVYEGNQDVTSTVPDAAYIWTRNSGDPEADAAWNAAHIGMRQITVTRADVNNRAIITCTLLSIGDMALTFEVDPLTMTLIVTTPDFGADTASYDPATGILTIDGTGYTYDPETQTITLASGLASTRTMVQFTFSDETGIQTRILQLRDTIRLIVENDLGDSTELRLTMGLIQALTDHFNVSGALSVGSWTPVVKAQWEETIADAQKALEDALAANQAAIVAQNVAQIAQTATYTLNNKLLQLCIDSNMTYINGAMIYTGSITADKIDVRNLYAWRLRDPAISSNCWVELLTYGQPDDSIGSFGLRIMRAGTTAGTLVTTGLMTAMQKSGSTWISTSRSMRGIEIFNDSGTGIMMARPLGAPEWLGPSGFAVPNSIITYLGSIPVTEVYNNSSTGAYGFYVEGNIRYSGTSAQSSDRRIKKNIRPIDPRALELLMGLDAVEYETIDGDGKTHYGLIAQQVREVLEALDIGDAALFVDENPERLALAYTELIAPLVAGYKAQQREIADLRARLERIEKLLEVK